MLAIQVPTRMREVAQPITCAVVRVSLLTSVEKIASKPACSASAATVRMSTARHPAPGMTVRASRCGSMPGSLLGGAGAAAEAGPPGAQGRDGGPGPSAAERRTTAEYGGAARRRERAVYQA